MPLTLYIETYIERTSGVDTVVGVFLVVLNEAAVSELPGNDRQIAL